MENHLVDSNTVISASKKTDGEMAIWLERNSYYITEVTYFECFEWKDIYSPEKVSEKLYLEKLFAVIIREGRYIDTTLDTAIQHRAQELFTNYNIKPKDALIAVTAEKYGLILVTADIDLALRLQKLNNQGLGNFKILPYEYAYREETFKRWNLQGYTDVEK